MSVVRSPRRGNPGRPFRPAPRPGRFDDWRGTLGGIALAAAMVAAGLLFEDPPSATTAPGADLTGQARITDGDSLKIQGRAIRLTGIDAPEYQQTCISHGRTYDCGREAMHFLENLIDGRAVTCQGNALDHYGRLLAVCYADGVDLNDAVVRAGWAAAYRRYSRAYVMAEMEAKNAGDGIWAGQFIEPETWRHGAR